MEKVNYITHLNEVFDRFNNDIRIKQGHITLYLAFFQKWNREFFKKALTVNRELIMERAKIKSKTTYHNYINDLNDWGYIQYFPSYHPARGSIVKLPKFGTTNGTLKVQNLDSYVPKPSQNLVSSYKLKTKENLNKQARPFNELEVLLFFKTNNWPAIEGKKLYSYIKSKKWKTEKWQTIAQIFVKNNFKLEEPKRTSPISGYLGNLHTNQDKDYDTPL